MNLNNYFLLSLSLREKICGFLIFFQWIIFTNTFPIFYDERGTIRWFHMLSLSILIFLINDRKKIFTFIGKYNLLFLLHGVGVFFAIISYEGIYDNQWWQGFVWLVGVVTFILLIPVFSNPKIRKLWFFVLIYTAITKIFVVTNYVSTGLVEGDILGSSNNLSNDRNTLAIWFNSASAGLLPIILLNNSKPLSRYVSLLLFLLFNASIIGMISRGGLLISLINILLAIFFIFTIYKSKKVNYRVFILSITLLIVVIFLFISFLDRYERFYIDFLKLFEFLIGERTDLSGRTQLTKIGLDFLWREGFFIGHGFNSDYLVTKEYLGKIANFHNYYLNKIVCFGLPVFLAFVFYFYLVLKELKLQMIIVKYNLDKNYGLCISFATLSLIICGFYHEIHYIWYFICLSAGVEYERAYKHSKSKVR